MNTRPTHTRGPWQYFPNEERNQFRIADADTAQNTIGWSYKADDAKLIAAAPDLLDVLKTLTFICESLAHLRGMERELLPHTDHARMIIDSIEG